MTTDTVTNTNDSGAGSLRQVLESAAPGDTIDFLASLAGGEVQLLTPLVISESVTIDGQAGTTDIAVSGRAAITPFLVQGGDATVEKLEIELGSGTGTDGTGTAAPTGGAGAILLSGGTLTLSHTLLISNSATGGIGVPATSGTIGSAGGDAGTVLVTGGSLVVENSTITGNTAVGGTGGGSPTSFPGDGFPGVPGATGGDAAGAIFLESGTVTISNSTVSSNRAVGGTGGGGGSGTPGAEGGGAGGGAGGNAAGVFYNRAGSLFVVGNTYSSSSVRSGDGGGGGYGGSGHFARNDSSYNNGGGVGGFGGSIYSPGGAGYVGATGQSYYPYKGLTVGAGGAGGAPGKAGGIGGAGSNAGGGGGGGGGGTGLSSATSLGIPAQPVACFAAGTRLQTDAGEVAVEDLRVGDHLVSAFGGSVPVVWIGHRRIDCRQHPRPRDVRPVRVRADAFGKNLPRRDLLLSPDHAVFTGAVLIPVRYLVNDSTVRQEPAEFICYFHIEVPTHDVILAEGLAAESYLETGNRDAFDTGDVVPDPVFAREMALNYRPAASAAAD